MRLACGPVLVAAAFVLLPLGSAAADDYPMSNPPQVLGTTLTKTPGPSVGASVAPASVVATTPAATQVAGVTLSRGSGLPVTGGDIAGLSIMGLAAIGAGTLLVRRSRPRRAG